MTCGGELLRLGDEGLLLVFRAPAATRLAEGVLLGAQGFERGDRGAALGVGGERLVDGLDGVAPRLLRTLDEVGIFAKQHRINHPASLQAPAGQPDSLCWWLPPA